MIDLIIEKIDKIKKYFAENRADVQDIESIDSWMAVAKRLFLIRSLKDHDGIKYVLEIFDKEIKDINEKLATKYSTELSDAQRDRLLDKKSLAQKYLDLFLPIEEELEKLEETVDSELAKL